jgi:cytochrome c oxidase cbb3-type subunit 3
MPGRISHWVVGSLLAALAFTQLACNDTPADLRPWRASDHDHTANPNADQVQVTDAGSAEAANHGLDDVTIVAWQQNCTSCHGALGRGDGPQGQLLHAADLSRPDWQATVTDEAIASTIRSGRGKMPAFNLPDATIGRLVALIRMLDLNKMQRVVNAAAAANEATAQGAPSAHASSGAPAPSASAPKKAGR